VVAGGGGTSSLAREVLWLRQCDALDGVLPVPELGTWAVALGFYGGERRPRWLLGQRFGLFSAGLRPRQISVAGATASELSDREAGCGLARVRHSGVSSTSLSLWARSGPEGPICRRATGRGGMRGDLWQGRQRAAGRPSLVRQILGCALRVRSWPSRARSAVELGSLWPLAFVLFGLQAGSWQRRVAGLHDKATRRRRDGGVRVTTAACGAAMSSPL
jgi:hypothetical protein